MVSEDFAGTEKMGMFSSLLISIEVQYAIWAYSATDIAVSAHKKPTSGTTVILPTSYPK